MCTLGVVQHHMAHYSIVLFKSRTPEGILSCYLSLHEEGQKSVDPYWGRGTSF